uniref:Nucleocapsid phosphoprotein n=1 Tax=Bat Coronavirus RaGD17 TaxID=3018878 RepID=A0AA49EG76_9NIDO|nr:nucleocapsid phosphoprotein [Bat Coronavirus RaGD17]
MLIGVTLLNRRNPVVVKEFPCHSLRLCALQMAKTSGMSCLEMEFQQAKAIQINRLVIGLNKNAGECKKANVKISLLTGIFISLGTGPHADAPFRKRIQGVHWVAVDGAKTSPTGLGVRNRNKEPATPQFGFQLPADLTVVESTSRSASRSQSRSRNQSQSRSGAQTPRAQQPSQSVDIVAAVKQALADLGIASSQSRPQSGRNTPKPRSRAVSPAPAPKPARKQMDKPEWKRVPNSEEDVRKCFGPRSVSRNFGDSDLVQHGVEAKHFPTIAELLPTQAALAFGSEITTKEAGEFVEVTYHYVMKVPKTDKNLPRFLEQVSAYSKPSQIRRSQSQQDLNADAPVFTPAPPATPVSQNPAFLEEEVEMVDEIIN